jgi:hypothetical protein
LTRRHEPVKVAIASRAGAGRLDAVHAFSRDPVPEDFEESQNWSKTMNRITIKHTLRNRLLRCAAIALATVGMVLAGVSTAAAACGRTGQKPLEGIRNLPFFAQPNSQTGQAKDGNGSIVGLWHVNYTDSTGAPFLESLKMWHRDGTELESANFPPAMSNFCLGVWKHTGGRTVQLHHVGWNFKPDGNTPDGFFDMTETDAVSPDGNTYQGVFDYKLFDNDGNLVQEVTGTQIAKRITV